MCAACRCILIPRHATHLLSEYWVPPRKPYLSVRRMAMPLISESEPTELPSSPKPDSDSNVPDMRLADSR